MAENAPLCSTMVGTYLEVIGCLGAALLVLLGGDMDFKIVDGLVMDGAGVLREPMDSNRPFQVMPFSCI